MSEISERHIYSTKDGIFIPNESARIEQDNSIPYLTGHFEVEADPLLGEAEKEFEAKWLQGRSAPAQVGVNLVQMENQAMTWNPATGKFEVPAKIETYGVARKEFIELIQKGRYDIGRIILILKDSHLEKDEIKSALAQKDIAIDSEYEVNDDGSVKIKISLVEFVMSKNRLRKKEESRHAILHHGRNELRTKQDIINLEDDKTIDSDELFVGGVKISLGKYSAKIDTDLNEVVKHLEGGTFLDAFRTTGIGERLGKKGYRQLELYNQNGGPELIDDLWVTVRFYPHDISQAQDAEKWNGWNVEEKMRVHVDGTNFAEVTDLKNPAVREAIFKRIRKDGEVYGRVITRNGSQDIHREKTPNLQNETATDIVEDKDGYRKEFISKEVKEFGEKLKYTKDQSRVLVTHELPGSTTHLDNLVNAGVRAFIFRSINGEHEKEEQNVYMKPCLHKKIWDLSKNGVSFYFEIEGEGGKELREFYKGFWVKPEEKERFDQIDTVVNMYGWHGKMIEEMTEDEVRQFFKGLIKTHGKEKLAIAHGKGPGFMAVADRVARELGIFSIGVGISVEKIGQGKANLEPNAILDFGSEDRAYRQELLDKLVTLPIFNIGGDGTHEESAITTCSTKILEYLPCPLIYVDITDGDKHLWSDERKLQKKLSTKTRRKIKGVDIGTKDYPLAKSWVPKIKHYPKNYEEALRIWQNFVRDPAAYWQTAGISKSEIKIALENHIQLAKEFERNIPDYLQSGAKKYLGEKEYEQIMQTA